MGGGPASQPAGRRAFRLGAGAARRKGWARLVGGVGDRRLHAGDARTAPAGCCVVFGGRFGSLWLAAEVVRATRGTSHAARTRSWLLRLLLAVLVFRLFVSPARREEEEGRLQCC